MAQVVERWHSTPGRTLVFFSSALHQNIVTGCRAFLLLLSSFTIVKIINSKLTMYRKKTTVNLAPGGGKTDNEPSEFEQSYGFQLELARTKFFK